jgi:hypothetical protein
MILTYDSAADAEADRDQQKALLAALGAWDRALRRDECGAWRINGKHGNIYTWGGKSWVLYVACRSRRHWEATKTRLGFCEVTQDCEDEGCVRLHQLPTAEQAVAIREALGIRKRMEFSAEHLERLRERMRSCREAKPNGDLGVKDGDLRVGPTQVPENLR